MLLQMFKLFLVLIISSSFQTAIAEEHGAAPAAAGGGGHGEAPAEGQAAASEKKSAPPEWLALQNELNTLKAKVKGKQDAIMKMLEEKKHGAQSGRQLGSPAPAAGGEHGASSAAGGADHDSPEEALAAEYKELQQLSQDYEKKRTVLMFRYPEKGKDPDRKYNRLQIKSLEEMEAQTGIDAQLELNMDIMKKQFPNRKAVKVEAPAPKKKEKALKENTIDSETIILSK